MVEAFRVGEVTEFYKEHQARMEQSSVSSDQGDTVGRERRGRKVTVAMAKELIQWTHFHWNGHVPKETKHKRSWTWTHC